MHKCKCIIYEIGFVLYAECNRLYNGAVLVIIWFFNCILIMNFDNEQAAISQKYVVCVRVKHRRDRYTDRSKTFKTVKLLQNKENYCCRFPFRELWIVSQ